MQSRGSHPGTPRFPSPGVAVCSPGQGQSSSERVPGVVLVPGPCHGPAPVSGEKLLDLAQLRTGPGGVCAR